MASTPIAAPTTLFVAGATGYTGRALVAVACQEGHRVVAHVRPGSPGGDARAAALADLGAQVDRTPWDEAALTTTLAALRPAVVFALLGTTRKRAAAAARQGEDATYEAVDRDLSLLLLRACAAQDPPPRFAYLSSLGADRPGRNRYLQARHEVEEALRLGPVPYLVARPSFLTGPDREESRPLERVGAVLSDGTLGALAALGLGGLRDRFASLSGEQVARGMLRIALETRAEGKIADAAELRIRGR